MIILFLSVLLVIGVVPVLPNNNTEGDVTLVLVIVRFWLLVPLLEPSTVTLLLNILIKALLANEPVKVEVVKINGFIHL